MRPLSSNTLARVLGLAVLYLAMAGCASLLPADERVRVTVSDIRLADATLMEQSYEVTLRIQNHGDQAIPVRGGSFDLALNGRDFASGVSDSAVEIPPFGEARIDVRMVSTVFGFMRLFQGMQQDAGETLSYRISGRLATGGLYPVAFSRSGEVSLPDTGLPEQ